MGGCVYASQRLLVQKTPNKQNKQNLRSLRCCIDLELCLKLRTEKLSVAHLNRKKLKVRHDMSRHCICHDTKHYITI